MNTVHESEGSRKSYLMSITTDLLVTLYLSGVSVLMNINQ